MPGPDFPAQVGWGKSAGVFSPAGPWVLDHKSLFPPNTPPRRGLSAAHGAQNATSTPHLFPAELWENQYRITRPVP